MKLETEAIQADRSRNYFLANLLKVFRRSFIESIWWAPIAFPSACVIDKVRSYSTCLQTLQFIFCKSHHILRICTQPEDETCPYFSFVAIEVRFGSYLLRQYLPQLKVQPSDFEKLLFYVQGIQRRG
jgi:hypothetical protein